MHPKLSLVYKDEKVGSRFLPSPAGRLWQAA